MNFLGDIDIEKILEELPRDDVQTSIDTVLQDTGIITNTVDIENETERIKKRKQLEDDQKKFYKAIGITTILVVGGFSLIWYIIQKKKK
jgi:hypothetical protein